MPTGDTKHDTPPKRTRIDWAAAQARYVALGPDERSFNAIAREFHVSNHTVGKHARADRWVEAARISDERVAAKAVEATTRSREQRAVQTATIRDLAADHLERLITPDDSGVVKADDSLVVQAWKEADRQYRLDIGEATDRIEVREVHEFVRRLVVGFDELASEVIRRHLNGKGSAVLAELRAGVPALLEQTAGQAGGE